LLVSSRRVLLLLRLREATGYGTLLRRIGDRDYFDYSLNEIAELVGATVGGVEAALSCGRRKLADSRERSKSSRVLDLYVE
jgi:hypothetical protein